MKNFKIKFEKIKTQFKKIYNLNFIDYELKIENIVLFSTRIQLF